jgi:hypothetical protein
MSYEDDINEISTNMNHIYITDDVCREKHYNQDMINYIKGQNIDDRIKELVIYLIENDSYESYVDIYNICVENNIELPPI